MYCKLWLTTLSNSSAIIRTPANVLHKLLLKYTFSLLSESQRLQIVQQIIENNLSHLAILGFDSITNSELLKLQQHIKQIISKIKDIFTKLNPNTEIVSSRECLELVIYVHF